MTPLFWSNRNPSLGRSSLMGGMTTSRSATGGPIGVRQPSGMTSLGGHPGSSPVLGGGAPELFLRPRTLGVCCRLLLRRRPYLSPALAGLRPMNRASCSCSWGQPDVVAALLRTAEKPPCRPPRSAGLQRRRQAAELAAGPRRAAPINQSRWPRPPATRHHAWCAVSIIRRCVAGLVMALPILVAALDASVAPLKAANADAGSES